MLVLFDAVDSCEVMRIYVPSSDDVTPHEFMLCEMYLNGVFCPRAVEQRPPAS